MNITKYWNKDELNRKTNEYNKWIKKDEGWQRRIRMKYKEFKEKEE